MKWAFTSEEAGGTAQIDPQFGRAAYITLVDTDNMRLKSFPNPHYQDNQGAGVKLAQLLADKKVDCLFTGHCGPNAKRILDKASICVVSDCDGTVQDAVQQSLQDIGIQSKK